MKIERAVSGQFLTDTENLQIELNCAQENLSILLMAIDECSCCKKNYIDALFCVSNCISDVNRKLRNLINSADSFDAAREVMA